MGQWAYRMGYCMGPGGHATMSFGGISSMKLHAKSLFSSLSSALGTGTLISGGRSRRFRNAGGSPVANLQALAAELHNSSTQGIFEYPRNWVQIAKVCGVVLIAATI